MSRVVVVGAGIVGLAVAERLSRRGDEVVVLEKEERSAAHQTGRNFGVIHSGLYYTPGSHKARMSVAGAKSMTAFAREHGVTVDICGKLVVATSDDQVAQLDRLAARAVENGVPARVVSAEEAREYEPYVRAVRALRVESTGIVDYVGVCRAMLDLVLERGGEIRYGAEFVSARTEPNGVVVETTRGEVRADSLVACAGLYSDRVAAASGLEARGAHRPVPRRVLRTRPRASLPRQRTHLPGARPGVPVPRRAPDEDGRRVRARGPERGLRARARGIPLA